MYETYRRVVIPAPHLATFYNILVGVIISGSVSSCLFQASHLELLMVDADGLPYMFPVGNQRQECDPATVTGESVECLHWDALTATFTSGPRAFITTRVLDLLERGCTGGACADGTIWQHDHRRVGFVANPESFELKISHRYRTQNADQRFSGDCRNISGSLVKYDGEEAELLSHQNTYRLGGEPAAYQTLRKFPGGRVTALPLTMLLQSAGVSLDDASDSPGVSTPCEQWSGTNPCRFYVGRSHRAVGLVLQVHIVYSNMWATRAEERAAEERATSGDEGGDGSWWKSMTRWSHAYESLLPSSTPTFRVYARHVPKTEANTMTSRSGGDGLGVDADGSNATRVVRESAGIRIEVSASGVLGVCSSSRIYRMFMDSVVAMGLAWTITELLVSILAMPGTSRLQRVVSGWLAADAQAAKVHLFSDTRATDGKQMASKPEPEPQGEQALLLDADPG